MEAPGSDNALRSYLADRDEPCPGCRYNLRGCSAPTCPECGRPIALTLARPAPRLAPMLFAYLAVGWALTAAIMNTARTAYAYAAQTQMMVGPGVVRTFANGQATWSQTPPTGQSRWALLAYLSAAELEQGAWALSCLVFSLTALIMLIVLHRRGVDLTKARKLRLVVIALFAIYGGHHLYMFIEQVMYW